MNIEFEIISIEGNIGSGKSTLLSNLKMYYSNNNSVIFLKEPVDEWNNIKDENGTTILEKFYSDQIKYSFSFQMMAYISRLKLLKDTVDSFKLHDSSEHKKIIIITERSLYTDKMVFAKMLFESGKFEFINYKIYLNWFDTFIKDFTVNKIIYVKTEADICLKRIKMRHRDGENIIPIEYLILCDKYHENMLDKNSENCFCKNQIILDGNIDIYENKTILFEWINLIKNFVDV